MLVGRLVDSGHDQHFWSQPLLFVMRDNHGNFAAREFNQTTDRKNPDRLNELLDHVGLKLRSAPIRQHLQRFVRRYRRSVWATRGDGRIGIGNRSHSAKHADLVAHHVFRITGAIHALVMLGDAGENVGMDIWRLAQYIQAELDVLLDRLEFVRTQAYVFFQKLPRKLDLADIQQQPENAELRELLFRVT